MALSYFSSTYGKAIATVAEYAAKMCVSFDNDPLGTMESIYGAFGADVPVGFP